MRHSVRARLARAGARLLAASLIFPGAVQAAPSATALAPHLARAAAQPRAQLLPPERFDQPARLREVRLSPTGAQLAWVVDTGAKAELHVGPAAGGAARAIAVLEPQDRIHWSRDGALLFVVQEGGVAALSAVDGAGGRIAAFGKDGRQRFAGVDRALPRHVLVEETDAARARTRLLRIGADGARSVLYDGPGAGAAYLAGRDGQPAIVRRQKADFGHTILQRRANAWTAIAHCAPLRTCIPVGLTPDGKRLLLRTLHADDREALVALPLDGGARRVVHQDPEGLSDLAGLVLSPRSGQPMLAGYELPVARLAGLDPDGRRIAGAVARHFPAGGVAAESCAASACLLVERGARMAHARYWLLDLGSLAMRPVLDALRAGGAAPDARQLADRIALRYPASDGAIVHGYLTLPGGVPARGLPLLTVVHGGPWSHVGGGYSPSAQMLANRGYAVFEPNFRGSTGYGERYTLAPGAGYGNGRAQADIIDGVRWLLAQGVGDPKRLGIAGASFGGYATLLALSHAPDLFRFGLAGQPPTDFAHTLRQSVLVAGETGKPSLRQLLAQVGIDPDQPAQLAPIARDAPSRHVAQVRAPLLLVAGGRDERVDVEAVIDYTARLQALGKPVSLLLDPDEGHNPRNPLARRAQLHLLLRMLHRYLGGPPAPAPDAELARYLARTLRTDGAL